MVSTSAMAMTFNCLFDMDTIDDTQLFILERDASDVFDSVSLRMCFVSLFIPFIEQIVYSSRGIRMTHVRTRTNFTESHKSQ